jgi:hypothetical protein
MNRQRPRLAALEKKFRNRGPDTLNGKPPEIRRVEPAANLRHLLNGQNEVLECYAVGGCSVIVTREYLRYHLSVARKDRPPTWDEIAGCWYRIVGPRLAPDRCGVLPLPSLDAYVNIHPFCYQVVEVEAARNGLTRDF